MENAKPAVTKTMKAAIATGAIVAAGASHAAIDTAAIVAGITDAGTAVGVIGVAVLAVITTINSIKYIRRAF